MTDDREDQKSPMLGIRYESIEPRPVVLGKDAIVIPADEFWSEEMRFVREELWLARGRDPVRERLAKALMDNASAPKRSPVTDEWLENNRDDALIREMMDRAASEDRLKRGDAFLCEALGLDTSLSSAAKWEQVKTLAGFGLLDASRRDAPRRPVGRPSVPSGQGSDIFRAQIVNAALDLAMAEGKKWTSKEVVRRLKRWQQSLPKDNKSDPIARRFEASEATLVKSVSRGRAHIEKAGLPRTIYERTD